ncbi:hypothetical protein I7I50_03726 [Histoplasma capsulatum G186AR]|uniref:Uncharacterized protein n=1 Tax=Ajellomyces capsulatus TaxID=5037 RepID=A0A8H7YKW4_AJECA|nr:hypothetical protein I7I52_04633 [Histoplasma capsulatum]QSS74798.1 hypothetical protein I7I50_03726 [Histoplasma capsulatum G186AR]
MCNYQIAAREDALAAFLARPCSVSSFVAHSMKDNCQMPWEETWGKTLYILDIDHWESPTTMKCCGGMHSIHAAKYVAINRASTRCTNLMRVWQMASGFSIVTCRVPVLAGPKFSL